MDRKQQIRAAVDGYFEGLARKDFDHIPFAPEVELRAPLAPGGSGRPMRGREEVRQQWWQPLPALLGEVTRVGTYFDDELTGAVAIALIEVRTEPPVTLRVADRLTVDHAGRIVSQENHFDPRDVTNPGWAATGTS
jgi:hypothetical protein